MPEMSHQSKQIAQNPAGRRVFVPAIDDGRSLFPVGKRQQFFSGETFSYDDIRAGNFIRYLAARQRGAFPPVFRLSQELRRTDKGNRSLCSAGARRFCTSAQLTGTEKYLPRAPASLIP